MTSPLPFLRPTPAADNAVGRPGYEKAALCWAPEAGLVTLLLCLMSVIYSKPESPSRGAFSEGPAPRERGETGSRQRSRSLLLEFLLLLL